MGETSECSVASHQEGGQLGQGGGGGGLKESRVLLVEGRKQER